ncbi:sensor histidine kinase [Nonomuraea longicatena]|uniref:Oxygen sensor histidine kinase NreB n=1 Tax=Nonomuraea longicatena TaxID=83682 RepID=A0ABP3Z226_9ACTN
MNRWTRAFHLLFFACLAIPAAAILLRGPGEDGAPTLALTAFTALYYGVFVVRRPDLLERLNPMAWHYLVLLSLLFVLIWRDPVYEVTQLFGMCSLPYVLLPKRWDYAGAVLLVGAAFIASGRWEQIDETPSSLSYLVANGALIVVFGMFANHLVKEGEVGVLQERARLAREIHDTLAQGFSGIITQLEAAEQAGDDPEAVRRRIVIAKRLARENLREARRSVQALRPEPLERARIDLALHDVAARWSAASGVTAAVSVDGAPRPLPPEVEASLLRAAQEGLSNVAKHARASRAAITLSYMDDEVTLDVLDDGVGFERAGPSGGYGLQAMRERAGVAGGTLTVESAPGEGTALCVSIPYV